MPKEGHFAKSSRLKQIKNPRIRFRQSGNLISEQKFDDYVITRFILTTKRDLPAKIRESNQRFLVELLPALRHYQGKISPSVNQVLPSIAARAPWQFFEQVQAGWQLLQNFLNRELKAVPVKKRVYARDQVTESALNSLLANIIANSVATFMTLNLPAALRPKRQDLVGQLAEGILVNGAVDWDKVRSLMTPYPFQFDDQAVDQPTAEWLRQLAQS